MKAGELISAFDDLRPNQYTAAQKLVWLRELDMMIHDELVATHETPDTPARPQAAYTAATDLLAEEPYAAPLYTAFLGSRVDLYNAEIQRYNQSVRLFTDAWRQYADYINRTSAPHGVRTLRV